MLIRLAGHYINNPSHIDKMICIKGLPEEWIFRKGPHGKELVKPWIPDIDENIPKDIRHLCDPVEIAEVFPPIEKGRESVVDHKTILGIKLDYGNQNAIELWDKIERYLEMSIPRDQKVPEPCIVAPDHKSSFNPHRARRTTRGSLEFSPCEVPVVVLKEEVKIVSPVVKEIEKIVEKVVEKPVEKVAEKKVVARCEECKKDFTTKGVYAMHMGRFHKVEAQTAVS